MNRALSYKIGLTGLLAGALIVGMPNISIGEEAYRRNAAICDSLSSTEKDPKKAREWEALADFNRLVDVANPDTPRQLTQEERYQLFKEQQEFQQRLQEEERARAEKHAAWDRFWAAREAYANSIGVDKYRVHALSIELHQPNFTQIEETMSSLLDEAIQTKDTRYEAKIKACTNALAAVNRYYRTLQRYEDDKMIWKDPEGIEKLAHKRGLYSNNIAFVEMSLRNANRDLERKKREPGFFARMFGK